MSKRRDSEPQDEVDGEPVAEQAGRIGQADFVGETEVRLGAEPGAEADAACNLGAAACIRRSEIDQIETLTFRGRLDLPSLRTVKALAAMNGANQPHTS